MTLPVSLRDVLDEMQMISDQITGCINRKTGELMLIRDEEVRIVGEDEPTGDLPGTEGKVPGTFSEFQPIPERWKHPEAESGQEHCRRRRSDAYYHSTEKWKWKSRLGSYTNCLLGRVQGNAGLQ